MNESFDKLSPYGPLENIRYQNVEIPTKRQLTFVRFALEQSAIQAVKDYLLQNLLMHLSTLKMNLFSICTFCGIEIEKEFSSFHQKPCELMRACKFTLYPRHSVQHDVCGFYLAQDMYDAHCRNCTIDNITPDKMTNKFPVDLRIDHPETNPKRK